MDIYVARQPIFDIYSKVHGYELLYRKDNQNCFPGLDDDQATAELIYNSFMVMGLSDLTDGTLAFINFSKELIDSEIPYLLPASNVVVEVLERDQVTQSTIEACKKLREAGYKIALDDFIPEEENFPLFEYADIIKVEYPAVSLEAQKKLIKKYRTTKTFLAEKIETREDYKLAVQMGYDLFQGYFFSKPVVLGTKEITSLNSNIFHIMQELNSRYPSFHVVGEYVERDLGLSYKLLKLVNSVYYGPRYKIKTIQHALSHLGVEELRKWFSIMMLKDMRSIENAELIKLSLIRAKFMELLAGEVFEASEKTDFFFAGVFSFIDVLLNKPMKEILDGLPISEQIKQALLGDRNEYRELLDCVVAGESADWCNMGNLCMTGQIDARRFMALYVESLRWAKTLNY